jgi:uncharacterized radical SAM superfamily Fe-S cluster-containing enzyme
MSELIDKTKSICPVCFKVIDADIVEEKGKVLIKKTCAEHGNFQDTYWSDYNMYINFKKYRQEGTKLDNPIQKLKKDVLMIVVFVKITSPLLYCAI